MLDFIIIFFFFIFFHKLYYQNPSYPFDFPSKIGDWMAVFSDLYLNLMQGLFSL